MLTSVLSRMEWTRKLWNGIDPPGGMEALYTLASVPKSWPLVRLTIPLSAASKHNMMNILYVWFPASWGPSVVEAIQTRNVTCLAKKPIVRDPHIFDHKEAARGSRAREVTCWIQKWNIKAECGFV